MPSHQQEAVEDVTHPVYPSWGGLITAIDLIMLHFVNGDLQHEVVFLPQ